MLTYVKKKNQKNPKNPQGVGEGSPGEIDVNFSALKQEQTSRLVQIKAGIFHGGLRESGCSEKVKGGESRRLGRQRAPQGAQHGHGCSSSSGGQTGTRGPLPLG